jgi:hypothetical protein
MRRRRKVFCVGRNKTGTTSLGEALADLGYRVEKQAGGEALIEDWARRDFRRIVRLCRRGDAFQDIPFSLPFTYQVLDAAYPGSKFILTVRDSADQWYESLVRFHSQLLSTAGIPSAVDLKNCEYRWRGWLWTVEQRVYGIDEASAYDRDIYLEHYRRHNHQVRDYFAHRPGDLLVLNLAEAGSMESLCRFLGHEYRGQEMPHRNRSLSPQGPEVNRG